MWKLSTRGQSRLKGRIDDKQLQPIPAVRPVSAKHLRIPGFAKLWLILCGWMFPGECSCDGPSIALQRLIDGDMRATTGKQWRHPASTTPRLRTHNQKMTAAAMQTALKKVWAHRS